MKRLSQHRVPLGIGAGVFLLALIGWFGLIAPQRTKATKLGLEIESTQLEITQNRLLARPRSTQDAVKVADVFRLSKAMPNEVDMPGVLLELSRVAGKTGVTLESLSPRGESVGVGYRMVPIDLGFQGTYYDLSEFLYRVRNLVEVHRGRLASKGRLFTVDSLSFSEGEKSFPQLRATLTVTAYVYDAAAGAPVTPPPGTETSTTESTPAPPVEGEATAAGATP